MKTTAFLIALATAIPAAAQTDRFTLRPYGMLTGQAFSAQTTFKAIFGQAAEPFWGAGAQLILRRNIYIDVSASRFKKTGQRAFINNGQTFPLGIPLTATLTPFEGAAYWTAEGEAKRQAFNTWIRTGKAYDAIVDFDAAVRDPDAPTKMQPRFNSGDNLHFNDAGYQAMANAIDLAVFRR